MTKKQRVSRPKGRVNVDVWKLVLAYVRDEEEILLEEHRSLIHGLIRARDHVRLADISGELGFVYRTPGPNRVLSQIAAFFKKNKAFVNDDHCLLQASENFVVAEYMCRETNIRLIHAFCEESVHVQQLSHDKREMYGKIRRMRRIIASTLGDFSDFLNSLPVTGRVTSGASSTRAKKVAQPYRKVGRNTPITPRALPFLKALFRYWEYPERNNSFMLVRRNRVAVVPKNFKTHRTIAAEPTGNLLFQLAADTYIKKCLRRQHIDLSDQTRNKSLARKGSIDGSLCTIDLSMASDTMARELIPYLFPSDWSDFFESVRSPGYTGIFGDGEWQKFSSMGNGCTFTLETLIFWAVCKACKVKVVSVYGDDIIVDNGKYAEVTELLNFLGFSVNSDKSYHEGPFRESCGGDYFLGTDIRPFFCKESGWINVMDACHLINGFATIATIEGRLWKYLRDIFQQSKIPLVPYSENTREGVHCVPHFCAKHKVFINRSINDSKPYYGPEYRAFVEVALTRTRRDTKAYLLWWLCRIRLGEDLDVVEVSSEDRNLTKVRLRPVPWSQPGLQTPGHLYKWSEFLSSFEVEIS